MDKYSRLLTLSLSFLEVNITMKSDAHTKSYDSIPFTGKPLPGKPLPGIPFTGKPFTGMNRLPECHLPEKIISEED